VLIDACNCDLGHGSKAKIAIWGEAVPSYPSGMRKRKLELAPFDASEFLDNEKVIAEYLAQALKDPDPDMFLVAVANVAKARGLSQVAKDSGLGRESLYKALKPGSKIRYETVRRLVDSLGVHLTVKAT
jgi:probable addiction module antidote protein